MLGSTQDVKVCYCDCHQAWNSIHPPVCVCSCRYHGVGRIAFSSSPSPSDSWRDNLFEVMKKNQPIVEKPKPKPEPKPVQKQPYRCPCCYGEGKIQIMVEPGEHYIADSLGRVFKTCKPCDGKGIVWG